MMWPQCTNLMWICAGQNLTCMDNYQFKQILGSQHMCANHIDYDIPSVLENAINPMKDRVADIVSEMSGFLNILNCSACVDAIERVACMSAFPKCTSSVPISPLCARSCQAHLDVCGINSLIEWLCDLTETLKCWTTLCS